MPANKVYSSIATAVRDFFGAKPGQSLKDFMDEWRNVPEGDRQDLKKMLEERGYKFA